MADPPPGAENGVEEPKTKKPSGNIHFKSHIEISYKYFALLLSVKIYNNQSIFSLDSAFKQQRLPAWQPILTAGTVLPTFFVIGVAFIPIGIGMMYFSSNVSKQPQSRHLTGLIPNLKNI